MIKKSIYILLFLLFTLFILFISINSKKTLRDKLEQQNAENILLVKTNDSLRKSNISLKKKLTDRISDTEQFYDGKEDFKGIQNPKKYLEDALIERKNLIPEKGVLGGTMSFSSAKTNGNGWIIGYYEDGHIDGEAIYTYKVEKNKKVEFTLLYFRTN